MMPGDYQPGRREGAGQADMGEISAAVPGRFQLHRRRTAGKADMAEKIVTYHEALVTQCLAQEPAGMQHLQDDGCFGWTGKGVRGEQIQASVHCFVAL